MQCKNASLQYYNSVIKLRTSSFLSLSDVMKKREGIYHFRIRSVMQLHSFLLDIPNDSVCTQSQRDEDHTFKKA